MGQLSPCWGRGSEADSPWYKCANVGEKARGKRAWKGHALYGFGNRQKMEVWSGDWGSGRPASEGGHHPRGVGDQSFGCPLAARCGWGLYPPQGRHRLALWIERLRSARAAEAEMPPRPEGRSLLSKAEQLPLHVPSLAGPAHPVPSSHPALVSIPNKSLGNPRAEPLSPTVGICTRGTRLSNKAGDKAALERRRLLKAADAKQIPSL